MLWYIKQLFPLSYWTTYKENDKRYFTIWRMWFGKCFDEVRFEIAEND